MATRTDRDGQEYLVIRTKDQRGALLHRAYNVDDLKELAGLVLGGDGSSAPIDPSGTAFQFMEAITKDLEALNEKMAPYDALNQALKAMADDLKTTKEQVEKFAAAKLAEKPRPGDIKVDPPAKKEKKNAGKGGSK